MKSNGADGPASDLAKRVGEAVRQRRKDLQLTQETTALLAECHPRFLRDLESGKPSLRFDKIVDVLSVLGLTLEVRS